MKASERATQIWPVLALAARNRQVLTYEILGGLISVPPQGLGQLLEPIQSYCLLEELPALKALVVRRGSGLPGTGFIAAASVPAEQLRVFEFDWAEHGCPTPETFAEAVARRPSNGRPEAAASEASNQ